MMHPLLVEFLIRIMSLNYGIERKQDFFRLVLSEMERSFKTREIRLHISNAKQDMWSLLDSLPPCEANDARFSAEIPKPSETENLKPLVCHNNGDTQLLLPFCHGGNPLMSFQMQWRNEDTPPWVHDRQSLEELAEKLGSYLAWENVLLQIAASKRHLQTIFDLVPLPMSVINDDHTIERANKAFSDLFGLPLEKTLGRKCYEVIHRLEAPIDDCHFKQVQEKGSSLDLILPGDRNIGVTILPMTTTKGEKKVIQIFGPSKAKDPSSPHDQSSFKSRFLRLYDILSQPLTVISLIADLMILNPENSPNSGYVQIVRREVDRIISILKAEREECLFHVKSHKKP